MKNTLTLLCCFALMSFVSEKAHDDFSNLFQNWCFARYKAGSEQEVTYKPSKEFGGYYGYQFRKDGTLTISRGVGSLPRDIQTNFEEVDGKWEIVQDSIMKISYKSNNRSYEEKLIIRKLSSDELILHIGYNK